MALEHGVMLSKTSPAFLHANSTSHTWCFSAIAEIIDNAYDPDVGATELRIDKLMIKDEVCLAFTDNGAGMVPDKLHHMLSFGYCEKVEIRGHKPVGQYGNGFKSGSMRLGKDAIVFTKCKTTWSVGFLSQTFLAAIKADTVLVPIITFDKATNRVVYRDDTDGSLKSIFSYSIFTTLNAVLKEYANLDGHDTGTRIIVYNLKRGTDGMLELDFNSNLKDIINPEHYEFDNSNARIVKEYTPEYRRSLKEYCSILFLKPRMKIIIRGEKVRTKLISKSLQKMEVALYRPRFLHLKPVKIILGFSTSNEDFGMMLYNKNRLIKAYERVGWQRQTNGQGVGVVGVVEVDFLEPIHNKQDFNKTDRYNAFMNVLSQKLNDYWQEKTNPTDSAPTTITTPWTWAQCDNPKCLKWRRMPLGVTSESLPDKWFCYMNLDPTHNRCEIEEEPEDEDALIQQGTTYERRVKKQKTTEQQNRTQAINQREESLKQREAELVRVKKEIERIRPLQENGSEGPTRVELEQARQQLEEAKRREEEQTKIIEDLKRQKQQMEQQQKKLGQAIMGDTSSVASISNIALHGSSQENPTAKRKRKANEGAPQASKKPCNQNVAPNNVSLPEISVVEDDDETRDVKPTLIVKLPKKSRDTAAVIVIDSDHSDQELPSAPEGKSESEEMTQNTKNTNRLRDKESASKKPRGRSNGGKESELSGRELPPPSPPTHPPPPVPPPPPTPPMPPTLCRFPSAEGKFEGDTTNRLRDKESVSSKKPKKTKDSEANTSSANVITVQPTTTTRSVEPTKTSQNVEPTKTTRSVRTQTMLPDNAGNAVLQLNNLRRNVAKLLKVILPDMGVFANIALENVDNALVEVLRVNDVTSEDQPAVSSDQTPATRNSATPKGDSKVPTKTSSRDSKRQS